MMSIVRQRVESWIQVLLIVCACLSSLSLQGCADRSPPPPTSTSESDAVDPHSGTILHIETEQSRLGIEERIWCVARWSFDQGIEASVDDPDWDSTDWTLIEVNDQPTFVDGDRFVSARSYLLEPFLSGEYSIPSPTLKVRSGDKDLSELQAPPLMVQVDGALTDSGSMGLDSMRSVIVPEEHSRHPVIGIALLLSGIAAISALLLLWKSKQPKLHPQRTIRGMLEQISRSTYRDTQEAFAELAFVLDHLDQYLQDTSEIQSLIRSVERARFDPAHSSDICPEQIANHTLQIIGEGQETAIGCAVGVTT